MSQLAFETFVDNNEFIIKPTDEDQARQQNLRQIRIKYQTYDNHSYYRRDWGINFSVNIDMFGLNGDSPNPTNRYLEQVAPAFAPFVEMARNDEDPTDDEMNLLFKTFVETLYQQIQIPGDISDAVNEYLLDNGFDENIIINNPQSQVNEQSEPESENENDNHPVALIFSPLQRSSSNRRRDNEEDDSLQQEESIAHRVKRNRRR